MSIRSWWETWRWRRAARRERWPISTVAGGLRVTPSPALSGLEWWAWYVKNEGSRNVALVRSSYDRSIREVGAGEFPVGVGRAFEDWVMLQVCGLAHPEHAQYLSWTVDLVKRAEPVFPLFRASPKYSREHLPGAEARAWTAGCFAAQHLGDAARAGHWLERAVDVHAEARDALLTKLREGGWTEEDAAPYRHRATDAQCATCRHVLQRDGAPSAHMAPREEAMNVADSPGRNELLIYSQLSRASPLQRADAAEQLAAVIREWAHPRVLEREEVRERVYPCRSGYMGYFLNWFQAASALAVLRGRPATTENAIAELRACLQ